VVSAGQAILCVEQEHPEVLLLVIVRVEEISGDGGHGLGIVETPRSGPNGLADDGPGGQLETIALCQHGDFSSPAGIIS
jgi:hypothetical protein